MEIKRESLVLVRSWKHNVF